MFLIILLNLYLVPFGMLVAAAAIVYWGLVWFFFVGKKSAIAISALVGVLALPMIISGHGVGIAPLFIGMLADKSRFSFWSLLAAPAPGWIAYAVLRRVWIATVYEPGMTEDGEPAEPWQIHRQ
jgi:hypothetical protein